MAADEAKLAKDRSSLDQAHEIKNRANDEYQRRNYPAAIRLYHECLLHAKAVNNLSINSLQQMARQEKENQADEAPAPEKPASGATTSTDCAGRSRLDSTTRGEEMKEEARELIAKCYNNLAACILNGPPRQPEDYLRAADYCDNVLRLDNNNEKAYFRKGCALMKAIKYDPAIECFKNCPKNALAEQHILECKQKVFEDKKRRDELIRANFAKARAAEEQRAARADGAAATNGSAVNGNVPH